MNLLLDQLAEFYYQYPLFCYVIAAVLLLLIIWKPGKVLKFTFLALVLLAILYVAFSFIDSAKSGVKYKDQGIERTEKALEQ